MGIDAEMFIRTKRHPRPLTGQGLRDIGRRLCSMYGHENFRLDRDFLEYEEDPVARKKLAARHIIYPVDKWEQDGPDILPEQGEFFYRIAIATRYYGVGYERGDLPFIIGVAEALEHMVPGCEVWYGGDSSGVLAEFFGPLERHRLIEHFYRHDHAPYTRRPNPFRTPDLNDLHPPECSLCRYPMNRTGFGPDFALYSCECGEEVHMRGDKVTRSTPRERDVRKWGIERRAMEEYLKRHPEEAGEYSRLSMGF